MTSPLTFFTEVQVELSKVTWPTRKQAFRMTSLVIFVSLLVGLFIGLLDITFIKIVDTLLK